MPTTTILEMKILEAIYSVARAMNSSIPKTIARARPTPEVQVNTLQSGGKGTERHAPSRRRSIGTIDPTSSATPRICAALTSG